MGYIGTDRTCFTVSQGAQTDGLSKLTSFLQVSSPALSKRWKSLTSVAYTDHLAAVSARRFSVPAHLPAHTRRWLVLRIDILSQILVLVWSPISATLLNAR